MKRNCPRKCGYCCEYHKINFVLLRLVQWTETIRIISLLVINKSGDGEIPAEKRLASPFVAETK